MLGVAPGPANGFTLDVIDCLERFGELIDWAMVILNPLEPWPGELVLPAARRYDIDVITRVVDYGGLFWDDVRPGHAFAQHDHRAFRPERLGGGRARAPGAHAPDRRASRADGAAARLPVEPGARPRALRGPDADRGARRREADRGQARRARRRPARARPLRRRARRDPRDRRQHRLHGAQGRLAAVRGRAAARSLAADGRAARARRSAGRSSPSATCRARHSVAADGQARARAPAGGERDAAGHPRRRPHAVRRSRLGPRHHPRHRARRRRRSRARAALLRLEGLPLRGRHDVAVRHRRGGRGGAGRPAAAARQRGWPRSSCRSGRTRGGASRSWSCCAPPPPTPRRPSCCARR